MVLVSKPSELTEITITNNGLGIDILKNIKSIN